MRVLSLDILCKGKLTKNSNWPARMLEGINRFIDSWTPERLMMKGRETNAFLWASLTARCQAYIPW